jgi:hypothetical protein
MIGIFINLIRVIRYSMYLKLLLIQYIYCHYSFNVFIIINLQCLPAPHTPGNPPSIHEISWIEGGIKYLIGWLGVWFLLSLYNKPSMFLYIQCFYSHYTFNIFNCHYTFNVFIYSMFLYIRCFYCYYTFNIFNSHSTFNVFIINIHSMFLLSLYNNQIVIQYF